jgi:hypothetical protein
MDFHSVLGKVRGPARPSPRAAAASGRHCVLFRHAVGGRKEWHLPTRDVCEHLCEEPIAGASASAPAAAGKPLVLRSCSADTFRKFYSRWHYLKTCRERAECFEVTDSTGALHVAFIATLDFWNPYPNPCHPTGSGGVHAKCIHRLVVSPRCRANGVAEWLLNSICRPIVGRGLPVILKTNNEQVSRKLRSISCMQFNGCSAGGGTKFVYVGAPLVHPDRGAASVWEFLRLKTCRACRASNRERAQECHNCASRTFAATSAPAWVHFGALPPRVQPGKRTLAGSATPPAAKRLKSNART